MKYPLLIFNFLLTFTSLSGQNVPELYLIVDDAALESYRPKITSHDDESLTVLQRIRVDSNDALTLTNIDFCQNGSYTSYQYELEGLQTMWNRSLIVDSRQNFYINGGGTHNFMIKVKEDFNPGWSFYVHDSLPLLFSPLTINSKDELLVTGGNYSPGNQYSFILKIDTSGNILQGFKFSDGYFGPYDNLPTRDGGWLLANTKYIIKTDSNLNQQWVTKVNQNIHLGSAPVETDDGYFLVFEKFSTDQIIGVFIDKQGNYKWDTDLLKDHHFGEAYVLKNNSILLHSNKYSGDPLSPDFAKLAGFVYNTNGQLQSYTLFNQKDGYLSPRNSPPKFFRFRDELLFCRSISWSPPLPFVNTAIGPVPFSNTSSNCLRFHNTPPQSLPFSISMQKVPPFTFTNFVLPQQPTSVYVSNYSHDSIIQLCADPFSTGQLNFPDTIEICAGETIEVSGLSKGSHYWSTGDTTNSIKISQDGQYFLEVSDPCGRIVEQDSFIIETISPTSIEVFGASTTYTFNEVQFKTNLPHRVKWYINDKFYREDTSLSYSFSKPGTYEVSAYYLDKDSACMNTDVFSIEVLHTEISFPNIFTPNGDGSNDIFKSLESYHQPYTIKIYNRYGNHIATTNQNGWDGHTNNGKPAAEGIYFYIVNIAGETTSLKGSVTLMR